MWLYLLVKQRPSQLGKRNGFCQWLDMITQQQAHGRLGSPLAIDSLHTFLQIVHLLSMVESIYTMSPSLTRPGVRSTPMHQMQSCCVMHGPATAMLLALHVMGIQPLAGGRESLAQVRQSTPINGLSFAAMSSGVAKALRAPHRHTRTTESHTAHVSLSSRCATWCAHRCALATCLAFRVGTALSADRWAECKFWSGRSHSLIA